MCAGEQMRAGGNAMSDATWKHTERVIARRLNAQRAGPTGRTGADVYSDWLSVEVKHREHLPLWLKAGLDQAATGAGEWRLPLLVLHEAGQRHDNDIVCLRLRDFEAWFG